MIRALALSLALATPALADPWADTLSEARGQTVWFNAWGGDARTNAFLDWAGGEVQARFGVTLKHVKLSDTAEAVNRVLAEQAAGVTEGGAVDLIWINGPNFLSMKQQGLLMGGWSESLPNARYLDLSPGAAAVTDFTEATEGMESPWRLAKFVFIADSRAMPEPPRSLQGLADWARAHPGRMTHPRASNFMGATFLKQALVTFAPDPAALARPVTEAAYAEATEPLWAWYEALRPALWRGGTSFPADESSQFQLLNDGEIDVAMAFDPAAAAALAAQGLLPESVRVFVPAGGSIGNMSFVAIPFNAAHKAGAQVVADFLLSPEVQARAQDITHLGAFSVLDPDKLSSEAQAAFAALPTAPALPRLEDLGPTLPEPHASWMTRLEADWAARVVK